MEQTNVVTDATTEVTEVVKKKRKPTTKPDVKSDKDIIKELKKEVSALTDQNAYTSLKLEQVTRMMKNTAAERNNTEDQFEKMRADFNTRLTFINDAMNVFVRTVKMTMEGK